VGSHSVTRIVFAAVAEPRPPQEGRALLEAMQGAVPDCPKKRTATATSNGPFLSKSSAGDGEEVTRSNYSHTFCEPDPSRLCVRSTTYTEIYRRISHSAEGLALIFQDVGKDPH
jgi:hypothetical protein